MGKTKKIAVITGTRADFGLYYPVLMSLKSERRFKLQIIATSMHLSPQYGNTYKEIEEKGFKLSAKVKILSKQDSLGVQAKELGKAIVKLTDVLETLNPDYIMVLGDRGEMLAASIVAVHLNIKIIHLHGGEKTGTVDDYARHMISQAASIHFVSCKEAQKNLIRMGITKNIYLVGAPGLDYLTRDLFSQTTVMKNLGLNEGEEYILFIQHPVTEEFKDTEKNIRTSLQALTSLPFCKIILLPNSDAGRELMIREINKIRNHKLIKVFTNFEHKLYLSILKYSKCLIGNSSSGIIEAGMFRIPVINIGDRQQGRPRSGNIIDVPNSKKKILEAWRTVNSPRIQRRLGKIKSPFYFGGAGEKIREILKEIA